jgi:hypothetical protein
MHRPTYHPTIAATTWTKLSTAISGFPTNFKRLTLCAEPGGVDFRFELRATDVAAPTLATDGMPLSVSWTYFESDGDVEANVDVYVYNTSGAPSAKLAVHVEV